MKSCVAWRKGFKFLPEIDEFNIDYKDKEVKLVRFLDTYAQSQRVNIFMPAESTIDDAELVIAMYKDRNYNVAAVLENDNIANYLADNDVPYYFKDPVCSWDKLYGYMAKGVSAMFISGELGFELDKVRKVTQEKKIQIRCYADIAQASYPNGTDGFKNFFIRPEDVSEYDAYVDVIEFYDSVDKQNVLYEVYFKDHEWNGNLREIIKGMTLDVDNYYLLGSEFAKRRIQCGKNCVKGGRCKLCDRLVELAHSLENSDVFEVYKRR